MFVVNSYNTNNSFVMDGVPSYYKRLKCPVLSCFSAIVLLALNSTALYAGTIHCDNPVAHLVSVEGLVESRAPQAEAWQQLTLNAPICTDEIIRTGPNSRGGILVEGSDTMLRLDQATTFQITTPPQEKENTLIELFSGIMHFISRVRHKLEVRTPYVNAAVDGTEFTVMLEPEQASIVLFEGDVLASNEAGSLRIVGEQTVTAKKGQAPQITTRIKPKDAVQWTLHYQPILHGLIGSAQVAAQDPLEPTFSDALAAMRRNDTAKAFASLKHIPPPARTPRFHNYRAALFLLVGRVEEAQRELEKSLQLRADNNSGALSLQAMIAVAQNRKTEALALANKALAANPNSAVPLIALSYAQQAQFDLQGAIDSINSAVLKEPDNPYAYARQSELRLSQGDLEGAEAAAQKAVALDPEIELTQTVLGFARLTRLDLVQAKANFEKAITLSSSSPMPHLGMALALIRQGQLEAGRRELEIATVLDPGNALVRSYMGKAYYEERRDKLATTQYELAKTRDPNDPTPWYYHALLLHQQGQTVEALHNLQTSVELNNNRAVYRSQLLMDQDQAARSASMGQIYRELNFEQLALIEGWKSLEADPTDHSGHRLLADTYAHLPRHEIARVSELLQAQLLQPLNSAPMQPAMAETSLYVPDGMGPSDLAFNEYSSLFHRDGVRAHVSAVGGSDDIAGEELLLSGVKGRVSFSLGQYHFETEGFRDNNDLEQDIWQAFLQANLSAKTSIQFEARQSSSEYGDHQIHFYPDDARLGLRNDEKREVLRLGLHHRFNPRSELIASVIHTDLDDSIDETSNPTGLADVVVDTDIKAETWNGEVSQLLQFDSVRVTAGVGYLERQGNTDVAVMVDVLPIFVNPPGIWVDPPATSTQSAVDDRLRHAKAYLYSTIDTGKALTWDIGLSYDEYRTSYFNNHRFNPKLGLTWRVSQQTTVRTAAFRTTSRPTTISQTIEPTEVAGFNQFFSGDGAGGEKAWRFGVAVDHRFNRAVTGGVELSRHERLVPSYSATGVREDHIDDELGRTYLYWTPTKRSAIALEYLYDRRFGSRTTTERTTHRFPLAFSYFHPSGLSAALRPTFVRQYGVFKASEGQDRERFWNMDLSVGYRLPKHRGQISLEVRNLLDEEFGYWDAGDPNNSLFMADRMVYLKASLAFH